MRREWGLPKAVTFPPQKRSPAKGGRSVLEKNPAKGGFFSRFKIAAQHLKGGSVKNKIIWILGVKKKLGFHAMERAGCKAYYNLPQQIAGAGGGC